MNRLANYRAPIAVNLEITGKCNLKCMFCFNDESTHSKPSLPVIREGGYANLLAVLDKLAEHEIFEVRWFGGEFSVMPRWRELMRYAHGLGFFQSFVSNGVNLKEDDFELMRSLGVTNGTLSIHGRDGLHDEIVGRPGAYVRVTSTMRAMAANDIDIAVVFTPNEMNLREFETFGRHLFEEFGVSSYGCNRLFHSPRYKNLGIGDYLYLLGRIDAMQEDGLPAFFVDSFPLCLVPRRYWSYIGGCSQSVTFAQVDFDGNIRNCSGSPVSIGNILREDLREIWQDRLGPIRELGHLPLSCRLCPHFCGGGCIASRGTGENHVPDEFIDRPAEESLLTAAWRTARNYARLSLFKFGRRGGSTAAIKLAANDVPSVRSAYKIREEFPGIHSCMISGRGLVQLNNRAKALIDAIDGVRSSEEILREAGAAVGDALTMAELEEVAALLA